MREEWLSGETLDLFKEQKVLSDLSYKIYTVPSQDANTETLANAMLTTTDPKLILEEVYSPTIIKDID